MLGCPFQLLRLQKVLFAVCFSYCISFATIFGPVPPMESGTHRTGHCDPKFGCISHLYLRFALDLIVLLAAGTTGNRS